jgi:hypothetical protein
VQEDWSSDGNQYALKEVRINKYFTISSISRCAKEVGHSIAVSSESLGKLETDYGPAADPIRTREND